MREQHFVDQKHILGKQSNKSINMPNNSMKGTRIGGNTLDRNKDIRLL